MDPPPDLTPRPKRSRRSGALTLSASTVNPASSAPSLARSDTQTSQSSTVASSRSSSPSKRQLEAEVEFSRPAFKYFSRGESKEWKEKNTEQIPCLKELMEHIAKASASSARQMIEVSNRLEKKLSKILQELERCNARSGNEDTLCDTVILPSLKLAKKLLASRDIVQIVNVKSIDVWPHALLPITAQQDRASKKRVDYSVGVAFGDPQETVDILTRTEHHTIAQSNHKLLRDLALYSHVEVKTEGNKDEARHQLSMWCAAGFQKMENMWLQRHQQLQSKSPMALAPMPLWQWTSTDVWLWVAVADMASSKIYVLEECRYPIQEDDPLSLLRVVLTMSQVMDWGCTHYLNWFRGFLALSEKCDVEENEMAEMIIPL